MQAVRLVPRLVTIARAPPPPDKNASRRQQNSAPTANDDALANILPERSQAQHRARQWIHQSARETTPRAHLVVSRPLHHLVPRGVHHPGRDVLVQEEQRLHHRRAQQQHREGILSATASASPDSLHQRPQKPRHARKQPGDAAAVASRIKTSCRRRTQIAPSPPYPRPKPTASGITHREKQSR